MHINSKGLRINEAIKTREVRLIDEKGEQFGVVSFYDAINKSREVGLDLVEVSPTANPPVCKIMDYGKYLYEQKRKQREAHKKSQHNATLKEIRLRPETDKHDLEIKVNHAKAFLEKGHKVQFTMLFRGRQMLHQDTGLQIFDEISLNLGEVAKIESPGRMSNRRMMLVLSPKA